MKKLILFIILFFLIAAISAAFIVKKIIDNEPASTSSNNLAPAEEFKYIQNDQKDIYIIEFNKPIEVFYDGQNQKTVREVASDNSFKIAVNGGYFLPSKEYAGFLQLNGEQIDPLSTLDRQVTGIVIQSDSNLSFYKATDFNPDTFSGSKDYTIFQTGPIIILQNHINNDAIDNSVNGLQKHVRSFLGHDNNGVNFIGITNSDYDLKTLSTEILKLDQFKNKTIDVINLDGGSSTFIYSEENKDFNIGTFKTLPIIIGVK